MLSTLKNSKNVGELKSVVFVGSSRLIFQVEMLLRDRYGIVISHMLLNAPNNKLRHLNTMILHIGGTASSDCWKCI